MVETPLNENYQEAMANLLGAPVATGTPSNLPPHLRPPELDRIENKRSAVPLLPAWYLPVQRKRHWEALAVLRNWLAGMYACTRRFGQPGSVGVGWHLLSGGGLSPDGGEGLPIPVCGI